MTPVVDTTTQGGSPAIGEKTGDFASGGANRLHGAMAIADPPLTAASAAQAWRSRLTDYRICSKSA